MRLERSNRRLSLTLESSHESKPRFFLSMIDAHFTCEFTHTYILALLFLASGDVASLTVDLAHKHVLKKLLNSFSRPSTFRLKPEITILFLILSPISMFAEIHQVNLIPYAVRFIQ